MSGFTQVLRVFVFAALLVFSNAMAESADRVYHFDIPAQSLGSALQKIAAQTGVAMFYTANSVAGLRSSPLQGAFGLRTALTRLLGGSGMVFSFGGDSSVAITPAPLVPKSELKPLVPVVVTSVAWRDAPQAYSATHAVTATRTDTPILETPASVQVVPEQVLEDQQVVRIDKALQNVSSVNQALGTSSMQSFFSVRGFETWDYYRNGVRVNSAGYLIFRPTANLERIEVLKGPASLLYGRIEPGGLINLITKQPLSRPQFALTQQAGSFDYHRTTVDAGGPLANDASVSYRFNLSYLNQGSFIDYVRNENIFVAPVLRWNVDERTQANLYLEYQHGRDGINYGIPALGNRPMPLARGRSLQEPGSTQFTDEVRVGFNGFHAFDDRWTLRQRFETDLLDFTENAQTVPQSEVAPRQCSRPSCRADRYVVDVPANDRHDYYTTVDLTGSFLAFGLKHTLLVGADYWHEHFLEHERFYQTTPMQLVDFRPVRNSGLPPRISNPVEDYRFVIGEDWYGAFLQDQIQLPYHLHVLAGVRYDLAETRLQDRYRVFGTSDSRLGIDRQDRALKPRFGLLWNPLPSLSAYGNYVENFGISNVHHAADLPPTTAEQWEFGLKIEGLDGRMNGTLAWFDLTKHNILTGNPYDVLGTQATQAAIGEARNRGLELDWSGELPAGFKAIASYAYIDSRITRDVGTELDDSGGFLRATAGNTGHRLYGVPRHAGSLWLTYGPETTTFRGLKFGAGVVARGQRQGNNASTLQLPGYVVVNLMAGYDWQVGPSTLRIQLNIDNLLDKIYFDPQGGGRLSQFGQPRSVLGSLQIQF
jgi:iron complex outermembrane receptor protein